MEASPSNKRPADSDGGPPPKKIKPLSEVPAQYSDAVRKKLASTSRTAQACDRCKERKMKCDTDPAACQPCRQKNLRCYTTDRVSGLPRERGQVDRAANEIVYLQNQVLAYQTKYGPLQAEDLQRLPPRLPPESSSLPVPSSQYVGWPATESTETLHTGPVTGTKVDILDGIIDVCDFSSDLMEPPARGQLDVFNLSRTSIINTIFGFQRIMEPKLPSKEEALRDVEFFLVIMSQYVPIVHRASMKEQVTRLYEQPDAISLPERVQIFAVLGILAYQTALRNHSTSAENMGKSHHFIHCALGFYRNIYHDTSLPAMQALALLVVHFRNMPKPGVTWSFSNQVLVRLIELQYHRDPDKTTLPPGERTALAKELRKRVFHSVLGICITTGCRVGLPAPWQFTQLDVPLPTMLCDAEISENGMLAERSGSCEFHPCLQLSRLLPLLTELHNNIVSIRRPEAEYLRTVEALNTKILEWKQHWDDSIKHETPHANLQVATLLVEQWAAEFTMTLHHPSVCTSTSPEIIERNLDVCHKSAKRILSSFHTLSNKYKGVDFSWHSTGAYAMGFGVTLYVYRRRKAPITREQYQTISNELNGWMSLIAYADVVLKTNNHLQHIFQSRKQAVEEEYRSLIVDPAPSTSQSEYHSVNEIAPNVQVKPEPPTQPGRQAVNPPQHYDHMQQSPSMHTQNVPNGPVYAGPHRSYSAGPWTQTPPQQALQYSAASPVQHGYSHPPYPQQPPVQPPPSQAPQYHQIPVSLAPILNNPNGAYGNYPNMSQGQTATVGPSADYSQMQFNQVHYYGDGSSSLNWPLITMPPGPQ